MKKRKMKKKLL